MAGKAARAASGSPGKVTLAVPSKAVKNHDESEAPIGIWSSLTTYLGYAVLIIFGHLRDAFGKMTGQSRYFGKHSKTKSVSTSRISADYGRIATDKQMNALISCYLMYYTYQKRGVRLDCDVLHLLLSHVDSAAPNGAALTSSYVFDHFRDTRPCCKTGKISTLVGCITAFKIAGIAPLLGRLCRVSCRSSNGPVPTEIIR